MNAGINAFAPVDDMTVACGAGAISLGFPVVTNETENMWRVPKKMCIRDRDPVLIALPASFFAFIIGNFFGRDYSAERRSAIDAAVKSGKDPISVATTDFERQMIS